MLKVAKGQAAAAILTAAIFGGMPASAVAAVTIEGQVQAGGGGVAGSTVSLWAATAYAPQRLAEVVSGTDGSFAFNAERTPDGSTLYLFRKTLDEPIPALGNQTPRKAVKNCERPEEGDRVAEDAGEPISAAGVSRIRWAPPKRLPRR